MQDEENKMNETIMETVEENSEEETGGSPIGLILAGCGAVAGGLFWIGKKLFRKKNYTEVIHHGRFGKEE